MLFTFCCFPVASQDDDAHAVIDKDFYNLTLSTASSTLALNSTPSNAGTLAVKKNTVTTTTNSPSGYKLYISTTNPTGDIYLDGNSSNNTVDKKITKTTGTHESPTALTTSSANPATWGYAIPGLHHFDAIYNEASPNPNAKFASVPHTTTPQLIRDHTGVVTNHDTDIYYGVGANFGISPGTYTTTINYVAITEVSSLLGGEATISPRVISDTYSNQLVTITTSLKTSMALGLIAATINHQPCTNLTLVSQEPVTITCQVPVGLAASDTGYDVEVAIPKLGKTYNIQEGLKVLGSMQSFTSADCQALAIGEQRQLYDARDNKRYFVSRLKMNRAGTETACWMTQNLRLDLNTTTTLTPDNTDIPSNWRPANNTINFTGATNSTPIPGWIGDYTAPYSANPGDVYHYTSGSTDRDILYASLSACISAGHTEDDCKHYSAGNYYNFTAAIAMNDSSAYDVNSQIVPQSICPKGWKLPIGMTWPGASSDFAKLFHANNIADTLATYPHQSLNYAPSGFTNMRANPLYFARSGSIRGNRILGLGSYGDYTSSSVSSFDNHYDLYFGPGYLYPTGYSYRYGGFSVRCVVRTE